MSDPLESLHLKLPYLAAAQAQKHVTHNEALRRLDSLVQLAVLDSSLTDPPATPEEGDRYIVAFAGTGDWAGHDDDVASFVDGAWDFATPEDGWLAFDVAAGVLLAHQTSGWAAVSGAPSTVDRLGINAAADDTNRLAVKSEAVLFSGIDAADGGSGDIRFVVNKEVDGDTASLLFQSGWSGRAEVGLAGDTDFVFKVSPDGTTWIEAIRIDKDTGLPTLLYDNGTSGLSATTMQEAIDEVVASGAQLAGFRNKLINGDGGINQRAPSSNADDTYGHDRHVALTQTGTIAVSTLTTPADGIASMMRLTQSQASAQRMGYAQIIEACETYGLRGKTVTLGGKLRCSSSQAIRYAVLEWTGTADSVTSDVVNDWTSGAYTAGNFFLGSNLTVTQVGSLTPAAATITEWSMTAIIGSSANNIVVFFWTEGTATQNVTLDQRWYLVGGDATGETDPFSPRHVGQELALCYRYFRRYTQPSLRGTVATPTTVNRIGMQMPVPMRAAPSLTMTGTVNCSDAAVVAAISALGTNFSTKDVMEVNLTLATSMTAGRGVGVIQNNTGYIDADAEF